MKSKTIALILAAGEGLRMKSLINKHLLPLMGKPLLLYALQAFENHPLIDAFVLVGPAERYRSVLEGAQLDKLISIIPGGATRQESCWAALQSIQDAELVVVHDAARPLVDDHIIARTIEAAERYGAAIAAVPVKDTLKEVDANGIIIQTPNRETIWQAQTPQAMKFDLLYQAHLAAIENGFWGTDEASLIERLGHPVKIVHGDYRNLKVTTPEDILNAESYLSERLGKNKRHQTTIRIGLGHDSHRFVLDGNLKPLILGGIKIQGHRGLDANSDGDVILHAIFNALSQAIGAHSIGYYADPLFNEKGITNSREYLRIAYEMIALQKFEIVNIGITIECQTPKLEALSKSMRENIAKLLDLEIDQIGITATSGDGLTAFGKGEGIQAWAIANLLRRNHDE